MSVRKHISLKTKLAAAICIILEIPHDHALAMHEEHVLSLMEWDHYPIRKADGGADAHHNLVPRPILEHREKTARIDVPQVAKAKRIRTAQAAHQQKMDMKLWGDDPCHGPQDTTCPSCGLGGLRQKRKIQSRPFPKVKHPMRSDI